MTSDRTGSSEDQPQRPTDNDPDVWRAYWQAKGQPWRTEPEIDDGRKEALAERLIHTIAAPFQRMQLSRGDIEWLMEKH